MVLDQRHGKGINTALTPRRGSTLEVKIRRMVGLVAISLWFLITDTVKGLTPSSLLG
jgi:hypothetical protein